MAEQRDYNGLNASRRVKISSDCSGVEITRKVEMSDKANTEEILLDCGSCGHRIKLKILKGSLISYRSTSHYFSSETVMEVERESPSDNRDDKDDGNYAGEEKPKDSQRSSKKDNGRKHKRSDDKPHRRRKHGDCDRHYKKRKIDQHCEKDIEEPTLQERIKAAKLAGHIARTRAVEMLKKNLSAIEGTDTPNGAARDDKDEELNQQLDGIFNKLDEGRGFIY